MYRLLADLKRLINKSLHPDKYRMLKDGLDTVRECGLEKNRIPSVILFCHHKSASTLVTTLLSLIRGQGVKVKDYSGTIDLYDHQLGLSDKYSTDEEFYRQNFDSLFRLQGTIYGPMRYAFKHERMRHMNHAYIIRDPIDTIISGYYSYGNTHNIPSDPKRAEIFLELRNAVNKYPDIDSYCLELGKEIVVNSIGGMINNYRLYGGSVISYSNLIKDPAKEFVKLLEKYGYTLDEESLNLALKKSQRLIWFLRTRKHVRNNSNRINSKIMKSTRAILDKELNFIYKFMEETQCH